MKMVIIKIDLSGGVTEGVARNMAGCNHRPLEARTESLCGAREAF